MFVVFVHLAAPVRTFWTCENGQNLLKISLPVQLAECHLLRNGIDLSSGIVGGSITARGCQGPQRKYAGYLSTTSWKLKVSGSRNSRVLREMMRKENK